VENILASAKGFGIEFDEGEEAILDRISELRQLIYDAERQRAGLDREGEDTSLEDKVIGKAWEQIRILSDKLR
jgi:hypothetical protein